MGVKWTKPNIFNIRWDNGPNKAASPLTEITPDEFTKLFHCGPWGLDGLNYGGSAPLPDTEGNIYYQWHYYFFHKYAIAVAERYLNSKLDQGHPATGQFIVERDGSDYGYDLHYYRLGCQHPNIKSEWPRMHDRVDNCPDCGFKAMYDTSG